MPNHSNPQKAKYKYPLIHLFLKSAAILQEVFWMKNGREIYAEFIGTFILVFAITASIVGSVEFTATFGALNLVAVALTAGLTLAVLIYSFGSVSGGHFNPAVTIGLWYAKKFSANKALHYIIAQILGAIFASTILWGILPKDSAFQAGLGATTVGAFGTATAVLMEIAATALFLIVILSVTSKKNDSSHAPLAIGF